MNPPPIYATCPLTFTGTPIIILNHEQSRKLPVSRGNDRFENDLVSALYRYEKEVVYYYYSFSELCFRVSPENTFLFWCMIQ